VRGEILFKSPQNKLSAQVLTKKGLCMSNKEEFPPLLAGIAYAIVFWVAIKGIGNWFDKNQVAILSALGALAKWSLVLALIAFAIYAFTRAIKAAWNWAVEITEKVAKLEEAIIKHDERLSSESRSIWTLDRQVTGVEGMVAELRKFTGYDAEMEKQKKLKEALEAVGAKEKKVMDEVTEDDDESHATGSEASESY
jgi:hypothetical protein